MKKTRRIILVLSVVIIVLGLLSYLEYNGYIWHNEIFASKYSIRGIDVSHWQGEINWEDVKNQDFKFVFIKASEGNDFVDDCFIENWDNSNEAGILRGAYHYFTTGSSGAEQAENFISVVPVEDNSLPPVIDIEEGGLSKEKFRNELRDYIEMIENHYDQKPILYVMYPLYDGYIKGDFEEYEIWIRDIIKTPSLSDKREWLIWQYCNRGRISGIDAYVDLNVFNGSYQELKGWSK